MCTIHVALTDPMLAGDEAIAAKVFSSRKREQSVIMVFSVIEPDKAVSGMQDASDTL